MSEPIWTFDSKLRKLNEKLDQSQSNINEKIDRNFNISNTTIVNIKKDIQQQILSHNSDVVKMQKNTQQDIELLSKRISSILVKLNTINGYTISNNFKKSIPNEDQLYNFAINCLSTSDNIITKEKLPNNIKIKNTYDNHIWILNRVVVDGLTISKWEDFGSDDICVANNDGIHGLVVGSYEKYRGYIDLQGTISINGLEEELKEIAQALQSLNNKFTQLQEDIFAKLNNIEGKIKELEFNR